MSLDQNNTNQKSDVDQIEPRKPARRILEQEIAEGLGEIERSGVGLFISGLSAGLDVGFSLFMVAVMTELSADSLPKPVFELLVANVYALGYVFVVLGRSELFTEHTTLAVLPVLNGRASLTKLIRLWALIYASNLVGAALFAGLAVEVGPALGVISLDTFDSVGRRLIGYDGWTMMLSGLLTGWLMGLLSWLVAASRDTISQIIVVWLVTTAIGFGHFHHSIAGSVEVLAGIFAGQGISWGDYLHFIGWTTLGNSIGGIVFVALIKYSHVIHSSSQPEEIHLEDETETGE
jgi:formate/nitrite transporter FocA (FNT family)